MHYSRINQSFHTNHKLCAAGYAAAGAYAHLLSYCAGEHSDGEIPEAVAEAIATPEHLATLNEFELLEHRDGFWHIIGYLAAENPPASHWKALRTRKKENKRDQRSRDKQKAAESNGHSPEDAAAVEAETPF